MQSARQFVDRRVAAAPSPHPYRLGPFSVRDYIQTAFLAGVLKAAPWLPDEVCYVALDLAGASDHEGRIRPPTPEEQHAFCELVMIGMITAVPGGGYRLAMERAPWPTAPPEDDEHWPLPPPEHWPVEIAAIPPAPPSAPELRPVEPTTPPARKRRGVRTRTRVRARATGTRVPRPVRPPF